MLILYHRKRPAQGTGTVPVVSAHFRSLCGQRHRLAVRAMAVRTCQCPGRRGQPTLRPFCLLVCSPAACVGTCRGRCRCGRVCSSPVATCAEWRSPATRTCSPPTTTRASATRCRSRSSSRRSTSTTRSCAGPPRRNATPPPSCC